mgnify:CR=1 FL=1
MIGLDDFFSYFLLSLFASSFIVLASFFSWSWAKICLTNEKEKGKGKSDFNSAFGPTHCRMDKGNEIGNLLEWKGEQSEDEAKCLVQDGQFSLLFVSSFAFSPQLWSLQFPIPKTPFPKCVLQRAALNWKLCGSESNAPWEREQCSKLD